VFPVYAADSQVGDIIVSAGQPDQTLEVRPPPLLLHTNLVECFTAHC
jgi:hypothetical protein